MKKYLKQTNVLIVLAVFVLASCKKSDDEPTNDSRRNIKYEITGNYTGTFTAVYTENINGSSVFDDVNVPWSKEFTFASNMASIGIAATSATNGLPGQTATLKIIAGGKVVAFDTKTTGSTGRISFSTLTYVFN